MRKGEILFLWQYQLLDSNLGNWRLSKVGCVLKGHLVPFLPWRDHELEFLVWFFSPYLCQVMWMSSYKGEFLFSFLVLPLILVHSYCRVRHLEFRGAVLGVCHLRCMCSWIVYVTCTWHSLSKTRFSVHFGHIQLCALSSLITSYSTSVSINATCLSNLIFSKDPALVVWTLSSLQCLLYTS